MKITVELELDPNEGQLQNLTIEEYVEKEMSKLESESLYTIRRFPYVYERYPDK